MSNKHYRTPASSAPTGQRPVLQAQGRPSMYSPEHLDLIRQVMRTGHPVQALIKEREDEIFAQLGGEDIEIALEGLRAVIRLGQHAIAKAAATPVPADPDVKQPRPLVSASEFIRATMELRRWHERRERLREKAREQAAADLSFTQEEIEMALRLEPPQPAPAETPRHEVAPQQAVESVQAQPRAPDVARAA